MFAPLGENRQIQRVYSMTEANVEKILHITGIVFLLTFALVPIFWMALISLNERPDFLQHATAVLSLKNYIDVIGNASLHFLDYLHGFPVQVRDAPRRQSPGVYLSAKRLDHFWRDCSWLSRLDLQCNVGEDGDILIGLHHVIPRLGLDEFAKVFLEEYLGLTHQVSRRAGDPSGSGTAWGLPEDIQLTHTRQCPGRF